MNTTEKLKLAREALESCQTIGKWASPALDADYIKKQSYDEAKVAEALAAIAADTAPAAASVDTPEFKTLAVDWGRYVMMANLEAPQPKTTWQALIAHINAWGAQQREEGRKELREVAAYEQRHAARSEMALAEEKDRADRAVAQLAARPAVDLSDSAIIDALHAQGIDTFPSKFGFPEVQVSSTNVPGIRRVVESLLSQDKPAAPATQQSPHDICRASERNLRNTILELQAQLAARAVGGVNDLKRYAISPKGREMLPFSSGDYYRVSDVHALLAAAPVAPVSDGDAQKKFEAWAYDKYPIGDPDRGIDQYANSGTQQAWEIWQAISAAFTQQKG